MILFAEEFLVIDAWVFLTTGLMGTAIAVFRLFSKNPEIVRKRKNFVLIFAISLAFLAVGVYLLVTGEGVVQLIRRIRGR